MAGCIPGFLGLLSIPFRILRFCEKIICTIDNNSFNSFQDSSLDALLLVEQLALKLSIPFRILLLKELRSAIYEKRVFQFLLGFFVIRKAFIIPILFVLSIPFRILHNSFSNHLIPIINLSIPFRILQTQNPNPKKPSSPTSQFLLGFFKIF